MSLNFSRILWAATFGRVPYLCLLRWAPFRFVERLGSFSSNGKTSTWMWHQNLSSHFRPSQSETLEISEWAPQNFDILFLLGLMLSVPCPVELLWSMMGVISANFRSCIRLFSLRSIMSVVNGFLPTGMEARNLKDLNDLNRYSVTEAVMALYHLLVLMTFWNREPWKISRLDGFKNFPSLPASKSTVRLMRHHYSFYFEGEGHT